MPWTLPVTALDCVSIVNCSGALTVVPWREPKSQSGNKRRSSAMPDTPDLAQWLLQQISEDERAVSDGIDDAENVGANPWIPVVRGDWGLARVLAECEAKRRIVEAGRTDWTITRQGNTLNMGPSQTLRLLALPYADREGYDESWRP